MQGKIKFWTERGFGFIGGDDGNDYFIHADTLQETGLQAGQLEPGDRVSFNTRWSRHTRRIEACDVKPLAATIVKF